MPAQKLDSLATMTPDEITAAKARIDCMSQEELCHMWRFAPVGHPYFSRLNSDLPQYFEQKMKEKGGMTPTISKHLGWEK